VTVASLLSIEGIGAEYAAKLKASGCGSTDALLRLCGSAKGRKEMSKSYGVSEKLLLEWVNRADLMRVRGVGEEYSDLLEAAGVDSATELGKRNVPNLLKALADANAKRNLVRRLPTESMVTKWVSEAKTLPKVVSH
jgi:hypothetical protein